jgi:diguanylate cyclase (GGDEF)-like protein
MTSMSGPTMRDNSSGRVQADAARHSLLPRQLSVDEFALFASAGQLRRVDDDEVIFRRGELGRSMFIVESGRIQLEFGDGLPDKIISEREFFGELVLFIGSHTRVANAVAAGAATLRIVDQEAFDRLVEDSPKLLAQFMRRSFSYLVTSEQQLIQNLKRRNEDLMVTLDSLRQTRTQLSTAQRLVQTDELSGLCNRRGLYTWLEHLAEHRVPGTLLAVLLVDIDRFKQINDRRGHLVGDQVLRAVADEVQEAGSSVDIACRLGGDEFALVLQVTGSDELRARATQIVRGVRSLRFPVQGDELSVSVSIGAAICDEHVDWSAWYSEADAALYAVKGRGGDGCAIAGAEQCAA